MKTIIALCFAILPLLAYGDSRQDSFELIIDDNCPYTCDYQQEGIKGAVIELLEAALKNAGFKLKISHASAFRMAESVKFGRVDATLLPQVHESYFGEAVLKFERPMSSMPQCFMYLNSAKPIQSFKQVIDRRIGMIQGTMTVLTPSLAENLRNNNYISEISGKQVSQQLLKMLLAKHIDIFVLECDTARYFAKKFNSESLLNYSAVEEFKAIDHLFLILSKKNALQKNTVDRLKRAFESISQTNIEREIFKRYGIEQRIPIIK